MTTEYTLLPFPEFYEKHGNDYKLHKNELYVKTSLYNKAYNDKDEKDEKDESKGIIRVYVSDKGPIYYNYIQYYYKDKDKDGSFVPVKHVVTNERGGNGELAFYMHEFKTGDGTQTYISFNGQNIYRYVEGEKAPSSGGKRKSRKRNLKSKKSRKNRKKSNRRR